MTGKLVRSLSAILLLLGAALGMAETVSSSPLGDEESSTGSVVVAVGDIACSPHDENFNQGAGSSVRCRQASTVQLAASMSPTAVLLLGDNQYERGELENYWQVFDATWGALRGIERPAAGNHEYETINADGYYAYFGSAAGTAGEGYYGSSLPGWHLLALNSNCSRVGGCNAGSPQERWLRSELAAHPDECLLAYWHEPRFSSGPHGSNATYAPLWRALYDYRAAVVLNGHDHVYERFAPQNPSGAADDNGTRAFTVGTGGYSLYRFGKPLATSEARINRQFGVLKLTLRTGSYDWAFIGIDDAGVLDSGSAACHAAS